MTHEEVEALQTAISSGQVSTVGGEGGSTGEFAIYDFSRCQRHSSMHLPALDRISDRFVRILRATLLTRFDVASTVITGPVERMNFREFLNTVSDPTCLVLFTINPNWGPALLTMEAQQALFFIDRLCGGSGSQIMGSEVMEFQEIGQSLIKRVALYILEDLEKAWRPVFPVSLEFEGLQFNPRYFDATAPDEFHGAAVGMMSVEVRSEQAQGKLYICVPRSTLQPLVNVSSQKGAEEGSRLEPQWAPGMKENLANVYANVTVELGTGILTVRNFLSLREGDIVQLNNSVSEELVVKVEGVEKFRGNPGKYRGHRALQVTAPLNNGSREHDGRDTDSGR